MLKVKFVSASLFALFTATLVFLPRTSALAAGAPITIAVLDSGIDSSTSQLSSSVLPGYNIFNSSNDTPDPVGHGTWVASTALTTYNSYKSSADPQSSLSLLPIAITDNTGSTLSSTAADGLRRAAASGAKIANLSFEVHGGTSDIAAAAHDFVAAGGIVFAAAGNDAQHHGQSDNPDIISIGSVNSIGTPSSFSSNGPFVDLAAPGENVVAQGPRNTTVRVSGTSFAAPYAASVAALVWAANPTLTNTQVIDILERTAHDAYVPGKDDYTGYGIIDPVAAIAAAKNANATGYIAVAAPVFASVVNDPSIPPMDPVYSHTSASTSAKPTTAKKAVAYTYTKRYIRKWNVKTKKYYWVAYYIKVRSG